MSEAEIKVSESEYARAYKLFGRPSSKEIAIYSLIAVFLIIAAVVSEKYRFTAIGALIGGITFNLAYTKIICPWLVRRNYRNYPLIQKPYKASFNSSGVLFLSENGEGIIKWENIHKWRENKEFILIYSSPATYHIIPKRVNDSGLEIGALAKLLEDNVGHAT